MQIEFPRRLFLPPGESADAGVGESNYYKQLIY